MDNAQNRPRFKKVKRPIKRPANSAENMAVPAKVSENPFNRNTSSNSGGFNLDSYLENDNLPAMQTTPVSNNFDPSYIPEEEYDNAPQTLRDYLFVGQLYTKTAVIAIAAAALLFGIFFAKVFLTSPATVQNGLQGVVINAEVPRGRTRCGASEKTQGCVLYIMNPQRQDLSGRDFYDLAAQLTGRQRFMIETGNMRYSSTKIRPGEFAQINIPPLQ